MVFLAREVLLVVSSAVLVSPVFARSYVSYETSNVAHGRNSFIKRDQVAGGTVSGGYEIPLYYTAFKPFSAWEGNDTSEHVDRIAVGTSTPLTLVYAGGFADDDFEDYRYNINIPKQVFTKGNSVNVKNPPFLDGLFYRYKGPLQFNDVNNDPKNGFKITTDFLVMAGNDSYTTSADFMPYGTLGMGFPQTYGGKVYSSIFNQVPGKDGNKVDAFYLIPPAPPKQYITLQVGGKSPIDSGDPKAITVQVPQSMVDQGLWGFYADKVVTDKNTLAPEKVPVYVGYDNLFSFIDESYILDYVRAIPGYEGPSDGFWDNADCDRQITLPDIKISVNGGKDQLVLLGRQEVFDPGVETLSHKCPITSVPVKDGGRFILGITHLVDKTIAFNWDQKTITFLPTNITF